MRSLGAVLAMLLCASSVLAQADVGPESRELRVYRLTLPNVQKATAVSLAIADAFRKDPKLQNASPAMTDEESSFMAMEREITASPVLAGIVKAQGMTAREYAKCVVVSIGAQVAAEMVRLGPSAGAPDPDIVPENIAWVTANPVPMAALTRALQAMGK